MNPLRPGGWRLVLKRAAHDRLVVAAAFVTILLAATLLASGPIYAEAVALAGLQRTLDDAPVREATLEISGRLPASERGEADRRVTESLEAAFGADGLAVHRSGLSDSFALPDLEGVPEDGLAVFGYYEDLDAHAELVAGSWPRDAAAGAVVEAVLPDAAADALGLAPGDTLEIGSAQDEDERVTARIAGLYRVNDVDDPFWWGRPLEIEGREELDFTTFGPLVVGEDAFFALGEEGAGLRWRAAPVTSDVRVDDLERLRLSLGALEEQVNAGEGGNLVVETGLPAVLERAERSLLVSRSGILVPSVQLAILAGAALLFLAGLLAERRSLESAILRSRGASPGEVGLLALGEGALLAVPAVLAGPWLAALSLQALNHVGPLADIGLELEPRVDGTAYVLAAVAGALCAAGLAGPALRSAAVVTAVREQGRPADRGIVQRAGLDLVLVALAALAYWQVRRYEGPVVDSIRGRLGIDPLLVAAPALGLLAGAVLGLRLIPAIGRLAERLATSARGLVAPLGTWQVARRPARYARAAVLLTLALAIGLFASAYGSTWLRSQEDRAAYEAGADVRVRPNERTGAITALHLASAYAGTDGVETALPVVERPLPAPGESGPATLLALDAVEAPSIVQIRPDLAAAPLSELAAPLAAERPELATLELPGEPRRLTLTARARLEAPDDFSAFGFDRRAIPPAVTLVLVDRLGLLHRVPAGDLPVSGDTSRLVVELAGEGDELPSYPLSLVAVELRVVAGVFDSRRGTFAVERLEADSTPVTPADGTAWTVTPSELRDAQAAPEVAEVRSSESTLLEFSLATGSTTGGGQDPVVFTAAPGVNEAPEAVPALVTDSFLESTGTQVGATLAPGPERPGLRLTGSLRGFPTLPPETGGAVVDLRTYLAALYLATGEVSQPTEWLIDAAPGAERAVADSLAAPPFSSAEIVDRAGTEDRLTRDPVALGISGALSLGFVAAALLAIVGFSVSSAVAAAERTTEFAVLRSLGLSDRQLSGWLALESGITALLALGGGLALGALVAWLVLPFVSLAGEGGRPFPEIVVEFPWDAAALLTGSMLAALAVVLVVQLLLLRRLALGPALRAGETR